ncbi:uncharacterized protein LACBIDRAFT_231484 [Laccaria bicolor S238N-H82]|uniref:Predicted protein n=1 Tax=Laccaria bicolor (strain S238N-H82 / ATCC MYA-4686) TaxID=486041 RepID=B0CYC8_LACBS|nr:uncharacterized protein LACBIDRAFT_231484 [Laccaria bicolor S238N-H82]EDR12424.1 predicted protein [Laccaria bicolor S238N-H82]|eukprot:XP_001876688.1 predicted protein [Laccaria bicolor S238N-H82]
MTEPPIDDSNATTASPILSPAPSSRPVRPTRDIPQPPTELTPLRAHYLKKSLVQLQFARELDQISSSGPSDVSTLSYLGPPFTPPPKTAAPLDLPFLRYIFRQFVLTFPFLAAAPKDFYSQKLQPFVAAALARNLSPSSVLDDGPAEQATRKRLLAKVERNLSLFVGGATKLVEHEDVVRLSQVDLDRLEMLAQKRQAKLAKARDYFEVNITCVRTVVDKGRMRSRVHEEFIVRTRRSRFPDVFVSRRYGDFKTLATELAKAHPDESVRPPPPKDRTMGTAPSQQPMSPPPEYASPKWNGDSMSDENLAPSRLAREKNRLTLRAYLHSLLSSVVISSSPVLRSFLLSSPTTLSPEELDDAKRREEADRVREDGRKRFAKEIASRVEGLRDAVKSVKGDVMGKDGLTRIFGTIKVTPNIRDLPANYRAVTEWARISLASTIFQQFVASDNASETFTGLKRIHGLMPYFMLKTALKISNPISMIRTVLDLFLAQPFGGRSLLQRMFTSSLTEEVRVLEEEIAAVKDKVDDPIMCAKIRQFVYAPREIQDMFKMDAATEKMNVLTVVLRSAEEPVLSRVQMHRLARAHRAHAVYLKHRESLVDSDDDDGPQDEDAWLLEDLKVLTHLYSRLRDREQLIALIFEGFTADLLKDIITIFYSPLAQVYRAASIADSLNDLQNFVNDLIKTVEQVEQASEQDPHRTVQIFIDLVQRHEQSFYHFVHKVHSKGEGLFDDLMRWVELFLTLVREGLGEPISLEFLLPHTGKERADILAEVDKVALYHYKLKVIYEDKLRRRFGRAQVSNGQENDADAEDEATQALVNGVVGEISFGELVQGDAIDLAAEETDEEESSDEYSSSDYESGSSDESEESGEEIISDKSKTSTRTQSVRPTPPLRSMTIASPMTLNHAETMPPSSKPSSLKHSPPPQQQQRSKKKTPAETLQPPELYHIPQLLPVFVEMVRFCMLRRSRNSDALSRCDLCCG